jgi:hypothetical protein
VIESFHKRFHGKIFFKAFSFVQIECMLDPDLDGVAMCTNRSPRRHSFRWWTALLSITICMGMFLVFEIFDLDESKFHIDVVDLDGTDCPELKAAGPLQKGLTSLYFLKILPLTPLPSTTRSRLSDLPQTPRSSNHVYREVLHPPGTFFDHAQLRIFPRREVPSHTFSIDEPA